MFCSIDEIFAKFRRMFFVDVGSNKESDAGRIEVSFKQKLLYITLLRGFQILIARKPINYFLSNHLIEFSQTNQSIE